MPQSQLRNLGEDGLIGWKQFLVIPVMASGAQTMKNIKTPTYLEVTSCDISEGFSSFSIWFSPFHFLSIISRFGAQVDFDFSWFSDENTVDHFPKL